MMVKYKIRLSLRYLTHVLTNFPHLFLPKITLKNFYLRPFTSRSCRWKTRWKMAKYNRPVNEIEITFQAA